MLTYILISRLPMTAWQLCGYLSFHVSCLELSLQPSHLVGVQWDGKMMEVDLVAEIICIGEAIIKNYLKQLVVSKDFCCVRLHKCCYGIMGLDVEWGGTVAEKTKPREFQSKPRELNDTK